MNDNYENRGMACQELLINLKLKEYGGKQGG